MFGDVVDSRARNLIRECGVRTSLIVEVDEAAERAEPVAIRAIRSGIGPFVDEGLDEALGLAVGLGSIRSRPLVVDAVTGQDVAIGMAAIAGAVVGQHALDADPDLGEPGGGELDRPRRALAALVGHRNDDRIATGVVDEDLERS